MVKKMTSSNNVDGEMGDESRNNIVRYGTTTTTKRRAEAYGINGKMREINARSTGSRSASQNGIEN